MVLRRLIYLGAALVLAGCTAEQGSQSTEEAVATEEAVPVEAPIDGAALYQENCAECHEGGVFKAPHVVTFNMMQVGSILSAMDGIMEQQASGLDPDQRIALAEFLSGQTVGANSAASPVLMCNEATSSFDRKALRRADAWGITQENTRFVTAENAGLNAADVPNLKLKWAFSYADATRARSQPVVAGGAIFMGSQDGTVYALDEDTGCARWTYQARAEIRSGLTISDWQEADTKDAGPTAYFGDFDANVYGVDAATGQEKWIVNVGDHPAATITGSPKLYDGVLYVPVSSR
jgi:polyvinyl alcohol dehydrogenase (cytochrome)